MLLRQRSSPSLPKWGALRSLLLACVLAACAERPEPRPPRTSPVVTLLDYFELGEAEVDRHLAAAEAGEARITPDVARAAQAAVARLRIHFGFEGGSYSTTHATAALVDGGRRAVTVGHAAIEAQRHSDARVELALPDGRVLAARVGDLAHYDERKPETDWAVLDVNDPPEGLPSLVFGDDPPGERLLLGYPGRVGIGEDGRAAMDFPDRRSALQPVRVLCAPDGADATSLEVLAGSIPIGGMSGAPCIGASGRLVAIQRAVSEHSSGGARAWRIDAVALDGVRASLGH